jgi:coenzyme F420-reducing hydrogenase alpha subunit
VSGAASREATVRRIDVRALARVEGHGSLRVRVGPDGTVEIVEFAIFEPPRFFERLLVGRDIREVPDIVARICGICPVAYQLAACGALEAALGIRLTPELRLLRRLLLAAEWIQSHAVHVFLLHAADYLGLESGFEIPARLPGFVENGLRMKEIGCRLLEVLGGRAVHPVNVALGGFHRAPDPAAIRGLVPDLEWGRAAALEALDVVRGFTAPAFPQDYECVAVAPAVGYLAADTESAARIVSTSGLDIPCPAFTDHFVERQVPHSTGLHCLLEPGGRPYLAGPLARLNLFRDHLPPTARRAADAHLLHPCRDTFQSIRVRLVEIAAAFEEAAAIARTCHAAVAPCRIDFTPRAGTGSHAVEAPRGLLWHRYAIAADGLVAAATIVPPTSQNLARIEADLRAFIPGVLDLPEPAAARRCEHLIRNYDPCISCAAHFLRFAVDQPVR